MDGLSVRHGAWGHNKYGGGHMVQRYRELVPHADTVLLANIGHYPQIEAPVQVLKHYLAFREGLGVGAARVAYS